MSQRKKDTLADDPLRNLVTRAMDESNLNQVSRDTGIKYMDLYQWIEGRKNRKGEWYKRVVSYAD